MWGEKVLALDADVRLAEPATPEELEGLEHALGRVPAALVSLLRETNGIGDRYRAGLVWPAQRIVADNRRFRATSDLADLYMPFDSLLFFADAGNGDQFAFPVTARGPRDDVFVWDHESDCRRWYAGSLEQYLEWWLGGDHPV